MPRQSKSWQRVKDNLCPSCERSLRQTVGGTTIYVPKAGDLNVRDKRMAVMREQGMALADIARQFNLSTGAVQSALKRMESLGDAVGAGV